MDSFCRRRIESLIISPSASIAEAIGRLEEAGTGALALCSEGRKLSGLLTDGDIRRAILRGVPLEESCQSIASRNPVTARDSLFAGDALHVMNEHDINHLPVVDEDGTLQEFLLRTDLVGHSDFRAGGRVRLNSVMISPDISISEAMSRLDRAGTGALALCRGEKKLFGLLTDGDIRRAILAGVNLDEPCGKIARLDPVTAHESVTAAEALAIMTQHDITQIPVLDADGNLVELLLHRDLVPEDRHEFSAVVMAGGFGTRLLPLTEQVPKPMLPIGDRPLLERTIRQLRRAGIRNVNLATHYLPDNIAQHFGNGEAFGVTLSYSNEDHPLGTAGGLRLVKRPDGPFVVINGDILTGVSFQEMLRHHRKYGAEITVGVRRYEIKVPFGVVQCEDIDITEVREKPSISLFVNAGIYILEPSACDQIPEVGRFDMTDLVQALMLAGRRVVSFPIAEYWLDVGRHEDYQKAQEDVLAGRI